MATSSKNSKLLPALNAAFNPTGNPEMSSKLNDLAEAIDDYIVDVVSKISGTTLTNATPLITPAVIVPLDGGASLLSSMVANAAVPLSGDISQGNLTTN